MKFWLAVLESFIILLCVGAAVFGTFVGFAVCVLYSKLIGVGIMLLSMLFVFAFCKYLDALEN